MTAKTGKAASKPQQNGQSNSQTASQTIRPSQEEMNDHAARALKVVRLASQRRLQAMLRNKAVVEESVLAKPQYAFWTVLMLIASDGFKIVFKAHFMTSVAKQLASVALGRDPAEVETSKG